MKETYFNEDTIAAIATAPNTMGAIGIIRLSGAEAFRVAGECICPGSKFLQEGGWGKAQSHYLYQGKFHDGKKETIDEGLFVLMRSPRSYTGEDCVEMHMHGNPALLYRTMETILKLGDVRKAEPGEFTFRSFRNGKRDLSQAEAVTDLISARTENAAKLAIHALQGGVKNTMNELKEELVTLLAQMELNIDFSDQDVPAVDYHQWSQELKGWCVRSREMITRFEKSTPFREGIRITIVGAPNSGKSTLFNRFLGEERSIVSDIKGTTRDIVREAVVFNHLLLNISDTAGLRSTTNEIEKEGVIRSYGELKGAHLVLLLVDGSEELGSEEVLFTECSKHTVGAKYILVINKKDRMSLAFPSSSLEIPSVLISAKNGEGMEELEAVISNLFSQESLHGEGIGIAKIRHCHLLHTATTYLEHAIEKIEQGELCADLLSSDVWKAIHCINEVTGETTSDDLMKHIFSKFCIGK